MVSRWLLRKRRHPQFPPESTFEGRKAAYEYVKDSILKSPPYCYNPETPLWKNDLDISLYLNDYHPRDESEVSHESHLFFHTIIWHLDRAGVEVRDFEELAKRWRASPDQFTDARIIRIWLSSILHNPRNKTVKKMRPFSKAHPEWCKQFLLHHQHRLSFTQLSYTHLLDADLVFNRPAGDIEEVTEWLRKYPATTQAWLQQHHPELAEQELPLEWIARLVLPSRRSKPLISWYE